MTQTSAFLLAFLVIYIGQDFFSLWINHLNRTHVRRYGGRVPKVFEGHIDAEKLSTITEYTLEKSRWGVIAHILSEAVLLGIILSGFLVWVDSAAFSLHLGYVLRGLFFFAVPGLILYLVELPFDYHDTFVVEDKYGFNRSTLKLWIMDHIKSGLVGVILSAAILAFILWIIKASPGYWWLWGFIIVSLVQLLIAVLYPILIAPLFNKFIPLEDQALAEKIRDLMERSGIRVKTILQMDAGQRSRHTNAYFTGIGKTKRIVLFDTLIHSHTHEEILAVLAHEVGHFKGRHILKQLVFFEAAMLLAFYLTYLLMDWPLLYQAFGFSSVQPYVGLFFIGIIWQKLGFYAKPLFMALSRHFERQADLFSLGMLKTPEPMISALRRLASDNLSNLTPHPLHVWFNYSHPPLVERISFLESAAAHLNDPVINRQGTMP